MKAPPIQWTRSPDGVKIAFQVAGDGPIDLTFCSPNQPNLDILWEDPDRERFFGRLASFSRLILYNQRGSGISGPTPPNEHTTVEGIASDLSAVLNAAGSQQAALLAAESGAFPATLYAATAPGRVRALVMLNPQASYRRHEDYPWGLPDEVLDTFLDNLVSTYGTGETLRWLAPELLDNERFREGFARLERLSNNADMIETYMRYILRNFDVRGILPTIHAPTLDFPHPASLHPSRPRPLLCRAHPRRPLPGTRRILGDLLHP